jgi:hypothetical protein
LYITILTFRITHQNNVKIEYILNFRTRFQEKALNIKPKKKHAFEVMEVFCFLISIMGLNRLKTGKDDNRNNKNNVDDDVKDYDNGTEFIKTYHVSFFACITQSDTISLACCTVWKRCYSPVAMPAPKITGSLDIISMWTREFHHLPIFYC